MKHPAALDFHHPHRHEKTMSIYHLVARISGRARILAEIEKCEVICSNCHRIRHWNDGTMGKRTYQLAREEAA